MFLVGTLTTQAQNYAPLKLVCQGSQELSVYIDQPKEISQLRNEMAFLIKKGNFPIVIEEKKDVIWIYLNDPYGGKDYPTIKFESDYFETIDLFPLKLTKQLKNHLKKGNKFLLETLGITYLIKNDEVISKINYNKFDRYVFWIYRKPSKSWLFFSRLFHIY